MITCTVGKLDGAKIKETVRRKNLAVDGQSVIIPWWKDITKVVAFATLCQRLTDYFKGNGDFISQVKYHSTVLSWVLDPFEREPNDVQTPLWEPDKYRFTPYTLTATHLVVASFGTVQFVLRNEVEMPELRKSLRLSNPMEKPGTLDGDYMNTCTTVIGYLNSCPTKTEAMEAELQTLVERWVSDVHFTRKLEAKEIWLSQYSDLSLDGTKTLQKLS